MGVSDGGSVGADFGNDALYRCSTLRDIARDPAAFVMKQGWIALDFGDERDLARLRRLYAALQNGIIMVLEAINSLRESPQAFPPTSGEGAGRHGGCRNPRGVPALYTSARFETAWLEAQQGFAYKTQPLTIVTCDVDCSDLLDLCDTRALQALAIAREDLACQWELMVDERQTPPTWALALHLIDQGIAGVRVPSLAHNASHDDVNLVFWDWGHALPHRVVAIDDEQRLEGDE